MPKIFDQLELVEQCAGIELICGLMAVEPFEISIRN